MEATAHPQDGGERIVSDDVIEPSRAGAHEERERAELEDRSELVVIDPSRAPARDLHETWREDATKTVGQLVAEGVDRKEAQRRIRWARRQAKRMAEAVAFAEALTAKRAARRRPEPGRTPSLQTTTENDSKGVS